MCLLSASRPIFYCICASVIQSTEFRQKSQDEKLSSCMRRQIKGSSENVKILYQHEPCSNPESHYVVVGSYVSQQGREVMMADATSHHFCSSHAKHSSTPPTPPFAVSSPTPARLQPILFVPTPSPFLATSTLTSLVPAESHSQRQISQRHLLRYCSGSGSLCRVPDPRSRSISFYSRGALLHLFRSWSHPLRRPLTEVQRFFCHEMPFAVGWPIL